MDSTGKRGMVEIVIIFSARSVVFLGREQIPDHPLAQDIKREIVDQKEPLHLRLNLSDLSADIGRPQNVHFN